MLKLSAYRVGDVFTTSTGVPVEVTGIQGAAVWITYDGTYSYAVSLAWIGRRLNEHGWKVGA